MIEIKGRILQRSVFIPGETVQCELVITNHGSSANNNVVDFLRERRHLNNNKRPMSDGLLYEQHVFSRTKSKEGNKKVDESVTLAWASAQVYCNCTINERHLKLPASFHNLSRKSSHTSGYTSFSPVMGERGHCLYSTQACVLFCDLTILKGETKKYSYSEVLPYDLPPSYRGQNLKFSYKVCIGIGRIGKRLSMIRLPFRLYEMKGLLRSLKERNNVVDMSSRKEDNDPEFVASEDIDFLNPENPFRKKDVAEKCSILDAAMETLTGLTVKRNMNTYNIQSVSGAVGKFCLSKYYYRLGEDILGTFDFSEGPIPCLRYTVCLQVEEVISKECLLHPSSSDLVHYTTMSSYEECCLATVKTHFVLPIPVTATAEFSHKIGALRWRLHFEFIIDSSDNSSSDQKNNKPVGDNKDFTCISKKFRTESMLWDLPLHVLATNPIQASLMLQAESAETIYLQNS